MKSEQEITIQLICRDLPGRRFAERENVHLGLQQGKAVVDEVPADIAEARFRFSLRVRENPKTGRPNLLGPHAQGTPAARFVYLCWGELIDGQWVGFGRAKIQLTPISWERIEQAVAENKPITATISMTDAQGSPVFASLTGEQVQWA